jgi:hypothetical protein
MADRPSMRKHSQKRSVVNEEVEKWVEDITSKVTKQR